MADLSYGKFVIPTGYESQQAKIALKRKIAEALMSAGLSQHQGMRSPFEALGQVAQAFVGKRLEDKAAGLEGELGTRIRGDYQAANSGFDADVNAGMDPAKLVSKYSGNPMLEDRLKPYAEALAKRLGGREDLVDTGGLSGFQPKGNFVGKPMPNKPDAAVWLGENGEAEVNPVAAAAAMYRNPNLASPSAMPTSAPIPIPNAGHAPGPPPPAGGLSSPSAPTAGGDIDLSKLTPEERQILTNEIKRRGGQVPQSSELPLGSPLTPPPPSLPQIGEVRSGFQYMGGDPNDKNSWRPQ